MPVKSPDGWQYVGCPTCGNVTTVPLDRAEPPPWCVHNGGTIVWREPHAATQAGPTAWTRTVRVSVHVL